MSDNCQDWTSTSKSDFFWGGEALSASNRWTASDEPTCDSGGFSLYCFQTDYSALVPPPTPPVNRRRIFASSSAWNPTTGIGAADTLCGNLASAQSFPGTYKAMLASNGASAASRFTSHTLPVVRPDGVIVADTDTAFFRAGFVPNALFIETEKGDYLQGDTIVTGGGADLSVPGVTSSTCFGASSWSSSAGTMGVAYGGWGRGWFGFAGLACNQSTTSAIYCLQE
jgi:hypothetical protein